MVEIENGLSRMREIMWEMQNGSYVTMYLVFGILLQHSWACETWR